MQPRRSADFAPPAALPDGQAATTPTRRMQVDRRTSYDVRWCSSFDDTITLLGAALRERSSLWITTPSPHRLHDAAFFEPAMARLAPRGLRVLECSEQHKTMAEVERVCTWAHEAELGRSSVLVSIGGGVSSDIVTVAASLLRRGIAHVRIPTTLLGLVDAAVGIKGAVNFGGRKNSLGCFHAADTVLLTPAFLATLPQRHLQSGLGEVLKAALAVDPHLFETLEHRGEAFLRDPLALGTDELRALIWRAATVMLDELEPNLFEQLTYERRMDFGHTFGPLLEIAAAYRLTHGESVAIDIAFAAVLSHELGWLSAGDLDRIVRLMARLGLARHSPFLDFALCEAAIAESIRHRGGELLLFLPTGIGAVRCLRDRSALTPAVLERSLARWQQAHT